MSDTPKGLDLLRKPFPAHQISKLPKPTSKDGKKGKCEECGGYHMLPAVHLDYVGHAALTDRLLDADPMWSWEPLAMTPEGLPRFDATGGLWIRLTVCGVSRLGYGHAEAKGYADVGAREKEVIGDALRNAAMRFGAALDLWHKGDLHHAPEQEQTTVTAPEGYGDWVLNLEDAADEGTKALQDAWRASPKACTLHMQQTERPLIDKLKAKAKAADAKLQPVGA